MKAVLALLIVFSCFSCQKAKTEPDYHFFRLMALAKIQKDFPALSPESANTDFSVQSLSGQNFYKGYFRSAELTFNKDNQLVKVVLSTEIMKASKVGLEKQFKEILQAISLEYGIRPWHETYNENAEEGNAAVAYWGDEETNAFNAASLTLYVVGSESGFIEYSPRLQSE